MKNLKLIIAVLLSPIVLLAQESKYFLTGKIPVFKEGEKVYLLKGDDIDSLDLDMSGTFAFNGTIESPVKSYIMVGKTFMEGYRKAFAFYLEPGNIKVTSADSLQNVRIKGGKANLHHDQLRASMKKLKDEQSALFDWYHALPEEQQFSEETEHKLNEVGKHLADKGKIINKQFLIKHSDSPIALDVLKSITGYFPEYGEVFPLYKKLASTIQNSPQGIKYLEDIQKYELLGIGKVGPLFSQTDTIGKVVNLSDFRGKYVLIDFWASWCGPCRVENPNLVKAFNEYKDNGFTVLGISLDDEKGKTAWLQAIQEDGLQDWAHLSDLTGWKNEASTLYRVKLIPFNFLLDPEGKIIAKDLRGKFLNDKLQEIFTHQ